MSDPHHIPATTNVSDLALVCHICGNVDQPVRQRCSNCWSLISNNPVVPGEEARREASRRLTSRRRRRRLKWSVGLVVLLGAVGWYSASFFNIALFDRPPTSDISSIGGPTDWPMYQRSPTHTAAVVDASHVPQGQVKWKFETDGPLFSSPAVVDGVVYLTTGDARIVTLEADTGELIWERAVSGPVNSSPAIAGDMVFFGLRDGTVLGLDKRNGETIWEFATQGGVVSSPAINNGSLYIGSGDGRVYSLDAATGKKRWSYDTGAWVSSSPVVFDGVVAVVSFSADLHILDERTGKKRLDMFVADNHPGSATFGNDYLFVGSTEILADTEGRLFAIDYRKQHLPFEKLAQRIRVQLVLWGMGGMLPAPKGLVWSLRTSSGFYGTPVATGDLVYGATWGGQVVAAKQASGEKVWIVSVGSRVLASPSISNDTLFIGDLEGRLHALDTSSGEERWRFATGGRIMATPVVDRGVLYLASGDGVLYALQ